MKILLTGAAGDLAGRLREPLAKYADELVSCDIKNISETFENEVFLQADISQYGVVESLMNDVDMVIHFAAIVDEKPFMELLGPNFIASYNIWEAASKAGVSRIVYASSVHAVGMHSKTSGIGIDAPHAPDTFYGLSKCFTEDLGKMYWDKRGIESVHLRIFSCAPVKNARALGTWLSYDDLKRLVMGAITTPVTGFSIIYGISDNDRAPVQNTGAEHLGFRPKDNAEVYAQEILAIAPKADPKDPAQYYLGGPFAAVDIGQSGMDALRALNEATLTQKNKNDSIE